ncbi:MAG TPA: serine hydrolase domain-containing protein [Propionibacteriaceae bacterium]|nr:serine hydrolase domain-containing protein [Propionibacteriaceae bacterium]
MRWIRTPRGRALQTSVAALMVAVLLAFAVGPEPLHLGFQTDGDGRLAARVRTILGADGTHRSTAGFHGLAVITVSPSQNRWAGLGNRGDGMAPTDTTMFEIGSVTKLFTGLMLADAVDRGEVELQASLDTYLPQLKGSPAGTVTLEELATHRSGLPAYADDVASQGYEGAGDADVEGITQDDVIAQAAGLALTDKGTYAYSNLGFALLGYALTKAAGAPSWTGLVTERVLKPAGMKHTVFVPTVEAVPQAAAVGRLANGLAAPYSVGPSYYPAGTATFSTLEDLASFSRWVLSGREIGSWALAPRYEISSTDSIGLGWVVTTSASGVAIWHNGSVPGFSSVLRIDTSRRRAVAILANSGASVDTLGARLLEPRAPVASASAPQPLVALAALACVGVVWGVLLAARARRRSVGVAAATAAQLGLVSAVLFLPWQNVPAWGWALASGSVFAASILGVDRGYRHPRLLILPVVSGAAAAAVFYGLTIWLAG